MKLSALLRSFPHVHGWLVSFVPYSVGIPAIAFPLQYGWRRGVQVWIMWSILSIVLSMLVGAVQDWRAKRRNHT